MLATNTSSLSVEQIGAKLAHPERLVGFHFFKPVAVMPLIEVVKTPHTDDATLSTAMVTAKNLGKNAVLTADTPGFVVNRLLAEADRRGDARGRRGHAVADGRQGDRADRPADGAVGADRPGGPGRWARTCTTRRHARSPTGSIARENLHGLADYGKLVDKDDERQGHGLRQGRDEGLVSGGTTPRSADDILVACRTGSPARCGSCSTTRWSPALEDIDLCMILGAGFPFRWAA